MLPLEHDPDLADLGWQYGVAKIDDRSGDALACNDCSPETEERLEAVGKRNHA